MYSFLTEEITNSNINSNINKIIIKNKNVKLNLMEKKIVYDFNKKFNYLNTDINNINTDINNINNDIENNLEEFDLKFNIFNPAKNSPPSDWENRLITRLNICDK
tara:strand:- start:1550 stop:1864 length:315 start_codon:yes stop_codon:yes gene_type:complete